MMTSAQFHTRFPARQRGQAIAEGVAAISLITAITVGAILLLVGAGTVMYYKLKLAYVANAAARTAAGGRYWMGAQRPGYNAALAEEQTKAQVDTLLKNIGMPGNSLTKVNLNDGGAVTVNVKVSALPIISGGILPNVVGIEETASEPYPNNDQPPCVVGIGFERPGGHGLGFYFPSYGVGEQASTSAVNPNAPSSYPSGKFAYYNLNNVQVRAVYGPYESNPANGPFKGY